MREIGRRLKKIGFGWSKIWSSKDGPNGDRTSSEPERMEQTLEDPERR